MVSHKKYYLVVKFNPPSINVTPISVNFLLLPTYCTLKMLNVLIVNKVALPSL